MYIAIFIALLALCTEQFTFVIQDASSLHISRKNLNKLYLATINSFDVNNQCTCDILIVI